MAKLTLSFKGNLLKVIPIKEGPMTIGRDPSCDIYIDSLAVHPLHARLLTSDGKSSLADTDTPEGTFVNHQRIDEVELADKDIIRVGKHVLKYIEADSESHAVEAEEVHETPASTVPQAAAEEEVRDGWLQILSGKHLGKTVKLKAGMTNLGKQGMPPALIALRNEGYFISSLGDDEITVGSEHIGERSHLLKDGDMIHIGSTQIQFYLQ